MTLTMPCPRCEAVLTADDEDELVVKVQTHVRATPARTHAPTQAHPPPPPHARYGATPALAACHTLALRLCASLSLAQASERPGHHRNR